MYESFFGFSEKPFTLIPDPSFLYLGRQHGMGLTMLQYGLTNRAGISVLTGEIGSGKTTLVRKLLDELGDDIEVGLISNTHGAFGGLLEWVAVAFDLPAAAGSRAAQYDEFSRFLIEQYARGRRTVLIVDEAQNLDLDTLEELRLLTNINADKDLVLQLVLVGQPELREKLRSPALVQFVQRIGVDYRLRPLTVEDTMAYVRHRLTVAGGDVDLFDEAALRFVHYHCGGVPRLINALCDTALVYAFADGARRIDAGLIAGVARERAGAGLFGAGSTSDAAIAQDSAAIERNLARAYEEAAVGHGETPCHDQ
ncbi:MAG: ExeA family protein [Gammaproteobacteria bacterium]